jgi:hypothetical protein
MSDSMNKIIVTAYFFKGLYLLIKQHYYCKKKYSLLPIFLTTLQLHAGFRFCSRKGDRVNY